MPWDTTKAKDKAEDVLQFHIPQLMFQAYSAWTESPDQQCLYVGILIGPYLTVMAFNHPPTILDHNQPPPFRAPPLDNSDDDESLLERDIEHICDVFPQERAPNLLMYMKHILEDPEDCKMGLSIPLRHIFRLASEDVIKNFEPGIIQRPSRLFSFEGVPQTSYDVTADDEVTIVIPVSSWNSTHTIP